MLYAVLSSHLKVVWWCLKVVSGQTCICDILLSMTHVHPSASVWGILCPFHHPSGEIADALQDLRIVHAGAPAQRSKNISRMKLFLDDTSNNCHLKMLSIDLSIAPERPYKTF